LKKQGQQNVRITIIDTFSLPSSGTQIFSTRPLLIAYDIELFLKDLERAGRLI
jgi:hypothetical protein